MELEELVEHNMTSLFLQNNSFAGERLPDLLCQLETTCLDWPDNGLECPFHLEFDCYVADLLNGTFGNTSGGLCGCSCNCSSYTL